MNSKKAKALRKLARDEWLNRIASAKPVADERTGGYVRNGMLNGLVHDPRNEASAIVHPESLRGITHIAKRVYTERVRKGLPV